MDDELPATTADAGGAVLARPAGDARVPWLLAGAVAVAAGLRLPFLAQQSLWIDETFTRQIALAPHLSDVWSMVKVTESTPPAFYWLCWAVMHGTGSESDAMLRLSSAVAGTLTVPTAFLAFRRALGTRVALAVAWLCAVSPVLVWYGLDARAYALFVLLGLVNLAALLRVLGRPSRARCAAWALTAVLCVWTHYFAVFFIAGQVLFVLLARGGPARRSILAWSGLVALGALPLVPLVAGQSGDTRRNFIEALTLGLRIEQTVREFGTGPNVPSAVLEGAGLALIGIALLTGLVTLARRRDATAGLLVVIIAVTVLPPLALTVADVERIFYMRNLLVVWPLMASLAAFGFLRARALPLVAYLAVSIVTVLAIQADRRYQNPDWSGVSRPIRDRIGDDPALVYPGVSAAVAAVYLDRSRSVGPVTTRRLAVIVEPGRTDRRELEALPQFPGRPVAGLTAREVVALPHGFRLLVYDAAAPQTIERAGWQLDLFHQPPVFVLSHRGSSAAPR
jgi:hypothetical protein